MLSLFGSAFARSGESGLREPISSCPPSQFPSLIPSLQPSSDQWVEITRRSLWRPPPSTYSSSNTCTLLPAHCTSPTWASFAGYSISLFCFPPSLLISLFLLCYFAPPLELIFNARLFSYKSPWALYGVENFYNCVQRIRASAFWPDLSGPQTFV